MNTAQTVLLRSPHNPVLAPLPHLPWAKHKVYNSAVYLEHNLYHLIFRAIGDDWVSRLGHATSHDGHTFTVEEEPLLVPDTKWDSAGLEDPRLTSIGRVHYLLHTAYDKDCARLALASSRDLHHWHKHGPILPDWDTPLWSTRVNAQAKNWSKAGALFPQKVNGRYLLYFGDHHIWPAWSDNLTQWSPDQEPVLSPRPGFFDAGYLEMGPPPILTDKGWLIIYHGINAIDDVPGQPRIYCLGAALLDKENPAKVIARSAKPLLQPEGHERVGLIDIIEGGFEMLNTLSHEELERRAEEGLLPQAVFCCGAILKDGQVQIYYGAADTSLGQASSSLEDILAHLQPA